MVPAEHVKVFELLPGKRQETNLAMARFRRRIGYVPQEDVLHANLTVSAVVYAILNDLELFHRENRVVGPEQRPVM
ncbi:hypothetical protein GPECTOR_98g778 [Gonium pectorale]|uniref:Uncharacterized protein n=1 Tax=Gonium pectorale TaxID=33097 RepID=A0A150G028_GONPE|nr:hypothetical protein GPECTOR_98g778 [Gonium pectorale]|eukprot:KXZ43194.1 hypothetical protein GPECTOR_98g778 [Gonium pectorale]